MRVLSVHNRYLYRGGEDVSHEAEMRMLRNHGHEVVAYEESNERVAELGPLRTAARTIWSRESHARVVALIRKHQPDVMHVQNFFPLISPSIYYAARQHGVPVVQTLRNYRLICLGGQLLRAGRVCEDCLAARTNWPGVRHRCYRNDAGASMATAAMLNIHHMRGTWRNAVSRYIALSEFARNKFVEGGLPAERIVVKPNFVEPDPGLGDAHREIALFVGRLSHEKGLDVLVEAWEQLDNPPPLHILGAGPMEDTLRARARSNPGILLEGNRPAGEMMEFMKRARFLVFPSICYETFGRVAVEAFACGTPVIASRLGSMQELVKDGETGLLFQPGDAADLCERLQWALAHPQEIGAMGRAARAEYEARYTEDRNYERLMDIYLKLLGEEAAVK